MLETELLARPSLDRPADVPTGSFATLLLDDDQARAAALSALLGSLNHLDVRAVHLDDPRSFHRKLRRILVDVTGTGGWVLRSDDARLTVRALAQRRDRETRVLVVIKQAETLRSEVLRSLQAMAPHFADPGQPTLQVLFVGRPVFRTLLAGPDLEPLRRWLSLRLDLPPVSTPRAAKPPSLPASVVVAPPTARRRPSMVPLALLAFAAVLVGITYLALREPPHTVLPQLARGAEHEPARSGTPPPTGAAPATQAETTPSAPARDLDRPLADPAVTAALHAEPGAAEEEHAGAAVVAPGAPRIVVHVPSGSPATDALSDHVLAALRGHPGSVEVRHVADTPNRPSIRYFHREDAPAARQAAAWMAGAAPSWTLQDFSTYRPPPSRGTVEVWLPRQN